jgi:hypothetical protein
VRKQFVTMEEQIPASQPPMAMPPKMEGQITPEQLTELKARARELAIQQTIAQQAALQQQQQPPQPPQVIYLRRNLTVAEVLLVLLLSCGIVTGIQWTWNTLSNVLPRIEVKVR